MSSCSADSLAAHQSTAADEALSGISGGSVSTRTALIAVAASRHRAACRANNSSACGPPQALTIADPCVLLHRSLIGIEHGGHVAADDDGNSKALAVARQLGEGRGRERRRPRRTKRPRRSAPLHRESRRLRLAPRPSGRARRQDQIRQIAIRAARRCARAASRRGRLRGSRHRPARPGYRSATTPDRARARRRPGARRAATSAARGLLE